MWRMVKDHLEASAEYPVAIVQDGWLRWSR